MKKEFQIIFKIVGVIYLVKFIDIMLFNNVNYRFLIFNIERINGAILNLILCIGFLYIGFKKNE